MSYYAEFTSEIQADQGWADRFAAAERGWEAEDDETLLQLCTNDKRSLLTNNVADFAVITRRWQGEGQPHHGLIYTSDASLPRTRNTIGRYVALLQVMHQQHPDLPSLINRTHWL